ncbi:hypothetical protein GA0115259_106914 [Streptomyces sp. MnatMP-M17]|nr:hypothetical protein GA0115259_106914 [Streptomyces sp. MnatMP-M17]
MTDSAYREGADTMAGTTTPPATTDTDFLCALIAAGGYWGLAPDWVPRVGYTVPAQAVLRRVETGLLIELAPRIGEKR